MLVIEALDGTPAMGAELHARQDMPGLFDLTVSGRSMTDLTGPQVDQVLASYGLRVRPEQ